MPKLIDPPATNPCGSCPYRRDVPSGVWAPEEYRKLPEYDQPTWAQPPGVFRCHQQHHRMCAGWVATHDMQECLAIRLACSFERLSPATLDLLFAYKTDVPLFRSGKEAATHGLKRIRRPDAAAEKMKQDLMRKGQAR